MSDLLKPFDGYVLTARVYPALVGSIPVLAAVFALYPAWATADITKCAVLLAILAALLYMMAGIARMLGVRIEPKLIEEWGGWPTTIILRHGDGTIESLTKRRYHARLQEMSPDLNIPTPEQEAAAPAQADIVYRSATRKLMETRRGSEYKILSAENAWYGFWRSLLGLKPVAVALSLAIGGVATALILVRAQPPIDVKSTLVALASSGALSALLAFELFYAIAFTIGVRKSTVLSAGRQYAVALMKTLDAS